MFQIKNNIVYLSRGENAVYSRSIRRDDKYNSPYVLSNSMTGQRIRMTLKASKNDKNSILEYEGLIGNEIPRFASQVILDITTYPTTNIKNQVYRLKLVDAYGRPSYTYHYYNGDTTQTYDPTKWTEYNFSIRIPISNEDTKNLVSTTYYYDLALITRDATTNEINYSDQWLEPTEFIIGGSFGE